MDAREDDDSGEMHYFNLTTMETATKNFSDVNKLGEGGFGPVYKVKIYIYLFFNAYAFVGTYLIVCN